MSDSLNYGKWVTGLKQETNTLGGATPPVNAKWHPTALTSIDAPYGTCTITAKAGVTYGGVTYAANDILFSSDGRKIYDSTGAVMNGDPDTNGGFLGATQTIIIVEAPPALQTSIGKTGIFWVFVNCLYDGIRIGMIDMTGNGGLGTFTDSSNSALTPSGGTLGTVKGSEEGVCTRMIGTCSKAGVLNAVDGICLIYKSVINDGATNWTDNGWRANRINKIVASGFPDITDAAAVAVPSAVGIQAIAGTDSGIHGMVCITPGVTNTALADFRKHKIATIWRNYIVPTNNQETTAVVECLTFDEATLAISNPTTVNTNQMDAGVNQWPMPPSTFSRFYAMGLEFSHSSTHDNAYLYYPNLNTTVPGGTLEIVWHELNASNVFSLTNKGYIEVLDNAGNPIWGGTSQAGRILAGIWRDPQKDGRLFISTPERIGKFNGAISRDTPTWSDEFPEEWGSSIYVGNPIQHCILENCNDPVTTVPAQFMQGTLEVDTMYRYGAPSFTPCSTSAAASQKYIVKCCPSLGYMLDDSASLWKVDIGASAGITNVNQVTTFLLTNKIGISHDRYRDMLYVWSRPTLGNSLSYIKYNTDNNVAFTIQSITPNAGYDDIIAIDNNVWDGFKAPSPSDPDNEKACKYHTFIAKKAGVPTTYSIGVVDTIANQQLVPVTAWDIDIATAFGGAIAGKPPTHIATIKQVNTTSSEATHFVTFGDRIATLVKPAGTWTLLATTAPSNFTSLFFRGCSTAFNPELFCSYGAVGANINGLVDQATGAISGTTNYITDPGGFPFPSLIVSSLWQNGATYFAHSPLLIDSVVNASVYNVYDDICGTANDTWNQDPSLSEHVGCFECGATSANYHLYATSCSWYEPHMTFGDCRFCEESFKEDCRVFLPCCNITGGGGTTFANGPMQLPGVANTTSGSYIPGTTYGVSFGALNPQCVVAIDPDPKLWFVSNNEMFEISDIVTGLCAIPGWVTATGQTFNNLEDIAFDKHGNVLWTHSGNDLDWASPWPGYYSNDVNITTTFTVPEALDTDYHLNNHIIAADNIVGVASFKKYTNDINTGLTLVSTLTNATINVGLDLSVDYNSGDYYTLGDQTGGASLNDLMSIDDATANHTFISNLATVCSFGATQYACGIERVRDTGASSLTYILSCVPGVPGATNSAMFLHTVNDTGLVQIAVVPLMNPTTATNEWPSSGRGLAYSDICSKWLATPEPTLLSAFADCDTCLANPSTDDCCYKLTNCVTGAVQYSNQSILDPYVGSIIQLLGDTCWEVERVSTCISPIIVTLSANPGPYVDCAACAVLPTLCYRLPNCNDPTDILYTDDALTPTITAPYTSGMTVQLNGECFCREIILNTCTGGEVALTIQNTLPDCSTYCHFYIRLQNCITGQIVSVDYNTSPTVVAAAGGIQAYEITVGGVVPDLVNLCWEKLPDCQGPVMTVYPIGVITTTHANCQVCDAQGATCVVVSHCCGDDYVLPQIVETTTGITNADIGSVVQADITVGGIIYSGCWEVSANSPVGDCTNSLPNADVTAINTSTVGTGNYPDCTYCPIDPCPVNCVLLEDCADPSNTLTVDGATGVTIGTDVVEIGGWPGCWKMCVSAGNPVAGTHWYYGEALGVDFSSGAAVSSFVGASQMANYNSSNAAASNAYTFRGAAVHSSTGNATIGGHAFVAGDLMFYTDGHWIYDRTHTKMNLDTGPVHEGDANVAEVGGEGKTFPAQGAVIIPVASGGNTNNVWHQYYVIQNSAGDGPIKWSIVDMTLNGGQGEVLAASVNTTLLAKASEFMCVNTTTGIGSAAYWHFFYVPSMSSNLDWANQHIAAIKFDNAGISASFVAVDMGAGIMNNSTLKSIGAGELLVNQTNDIIVLRIQEDLAAEAKNWTVFVWGLNPVTALSATAQLGWMMNNGYNGGANNGVYSWIVGGMFQEQVESIAGHCYEGLTAINNARTVAFSPNGNIIWFSTATYYDTATPYTVPDAKAGYSLHAFNLKKYAQDMWAAGAFLIPTVTTDAAIFDTGADHIWSPPGSGWSGSCNSYKVFPDANSGTGWYGGYDDTRCHTVIVDLTCAPDGKLWLNLVEQEFNVPWQQSVGQGQQITNSLLRLDDPNNAFSVQEGMLGNIPVPSFDIGGRRMGERFPVWLNMPCPCDPLNVVSPVTITTTHNDCTDCAVPPGDCYILTECDCTGGSAGYNSCSVNDPTTMPPNMITYGKSWSPTCSASGPERWSQIVSAVMALAGGVNQTINMSYSFINDGATFPIGIPGFGPAVAVEQGPGTANPTGVSPTCAAYNKTYQITHAQFKTEIQTMFAEIKAMFEGMFNTNCGYNANLIINFTDLGYETGYTAGDPAMGTNTITAWNGTSFTDSNGVAGIGDFRVGLSDFGVLDPAGGTGCGNSGGASGILGLCFTGDINNNITGITKTSPEVGLLLFDVNEDWRKAGDAVVANSFSLIRVGMHEILHAFGFGHDFLTFGGVGPAGDCTALCDCPCYQSKSSCPGLNHCETFPGSGVWVPCCPGIMPNSDALMGPFATTASFATEFPTGLLGPEGIYDRRAACGIYGNSDLNYACQDGVCLGGSGCVYVTHYSDDPTLAGYVGGVVVWDDGSAAGERCWEVDIVQPCPGGVTLINPVNITGGDPTWDCNDCTVGSNDCYTLDLCPCTTVMGAPQQVITTTDLSQWCYGTIGNGTVIEIDLYPGACYEINCTPQPCPVAGAVVVVVTNSYQDCTQCCDDNNQCYQLCPCGQATATVDTCSALTEIMVGVSTSKGMALQFISDVANSPLNSTDMATLTYGNNIQPPGPNPCIAPGGGHMRLFPPVLPNNGTFTCYEPGTLTPPPGIAAGYNKWTDFLADLVGLGVAGVSNPATPYLGIASLIKVHFGLPSIPPFAITQDRCACTTTAPCTVVTNDLSAELGQVVTIGPGAPGILDTDGVDCYDVELCGPCNTPSCTPVGPVTVTGLYQDCNDCGGATLCDCYQLIDCEDANNIINNVCQSADLALAYSTGGVIKINGNSAQCWIVECEDPSICDPATCVTVAVTGSYVDCFACTGSYCYECAGPGSCLCTVAAGCGPGTYPDCPTMFLNETDCCPTELGYNCVGPATGPCACEPCYTLPCDYATLPLCQNAPLPSCCSTIDESYDCLWDVGTASYICVDPGNGTGDFTSLVDCQTAVINNVQPCYVESWNCVTNNGVSVCTDPGDGSGTWNNTNGGLVACQACNGCPADPTCVGVIPNYDCDPAFGCVTNYAGTGEYTTLQECVEDCDSHDPEEGTFEAECENCLDEIDMKKFFDKVADVCDDCNVPFGLTDQEVTCDTGCFGNSNIYVFLDVTSTFGGTYLNRLQECINFKQNTIIPAFQQLQADYPSYTGHLYIIPGAWPHGSLFGPCNNCNGTGAAAPGSPTAPEDWLAWTQYPLSGNKGANGSGVNPMATGTLPTAQRVIMGHTMVNGVGGAPINCNGTAYDAATHGPLLESLMVLPGSYATDGFTQVNPWQDGLGKEGMSDPYHEFQGGDIDSVVIIFQDESRTPGNYGYYEDIAGSNQSGGICSAATWAGVPATTWNSLGTDPGNVLAPQWKTDYNNYMSLHQYGWDVNGVANLNPWVTTQKTMIYAGSHDTPNFVAQAKIGFLYHMFGAVGAQVMGANISYQGHISCADYVGVPAAFGFDTFVATDVTIPNPYMGASAGGDPSLPTGYQGGSLSNYGMAFHIPDYPIAQLNSSMLYELWKEYLSDC